MWLLTSLPSFYIIPKELQVVGRYESIRGDEGVSLGANAMPTSRSGPLPRGQSLQRLSTSAINYYIHGDNLKLMGGGGARRKARNSSDASDAKRPFSRPSLRACACNSNSIPENPLNHQSNMKKNHYNPPAARCSFGLAFPLPPWRPNTRHMSAFRVCRATSTRLARTTLTGGAPAPRRKGFQNKIPRM